MTGLGARRADWDDDRLTAAFGARAERAVAPRDLATATFERVRSARRPARWGGLRRRIAIGASVAAVVAAVAVVGLSRLGIDRGPAAGELGRLGLTVMTVPEAIAVRDGGSNDHEIAVRGWLGELPAVPCQPVGRATVNPVQLECPHTARWLTRDPERPDSTRPPEGPAIQPAFPFLDLSVLGPAPGSVPELVVVGHFDDRRAIMCADADRPACEDVFVVDRLVSIDGRPVEPSTVLSLQRLEPFGQVQPRRTAAEIDSLIAGIAPNLEISSRVAIPGQRIFEIEPSLGTGTLGIIDRQLVWVVSGLEPRAGEPPRLRTFIVDDTQPEAFEGVPWSTSNVGFIPLALPAPPRPTSSPAPTANPTAVVTSDVDFPEAWGPLRVQSVAEAIADSTGMDDAQPEAVAVRGWYVPPDPTVSCPELQDPIGPVEQPCPVGRHWLLDAPERLWDDPRPPWIDRLPTGPALNPIIPADIPFDVPNLWFDTGPNPLPVVVIGHFRDPRTAFGGEPNDLVADALVWRAGVATVNVPVGRIDGALDDPLAVMIRVQRDAGSSIDSWLSLTTGAALVEDDPSGDPLPPELATAERVWIVRRLVERHEGGVAIERAYTADGSNRVWSSSLCCMVWLETRLLTALGGPPILETFDYPGDILDVRTGPPDGAASWIEGQGPPGTGTVMLGVIEGRPNELRIAWIGSECDRTWQLTWQTNEVLLWPREPQLACSQAGVRREVVLTLDHAVDLDAIRVSNGGTGG